MRQKISFLPIGRAAPTIPLICSRSVCFLPGGTSDSKTHVGWHTFRHTYRTFLDETGAPLSAQQELMRHATPDMTLMYGEACTPSKRKANLKVVKMVLAESKGRKRKKRAQR